MSAVQNQSKLTPLAELNCVWPPVAVDVGLIGKFKLFVERSLGVPSQQYRWARGHQVNSAKHPNG